MAQPELFQDTFYKWLEANGVTFDWTNWEGAPKPPFRALIDLNALKVGVAELVGYLPSEDES